MNSTLWLSGTPQGQAIKRRIANLLQEAPPTAPGGITVSMVNIETLIFAHPTVAPLLTNLSEEEVASYNISSQFSLSLTRVSERHEPEVKDRKVNFVSNSFFKDAVSLTYLL